MRSSQSTLGKRLAERRFVYDAAQKTRERIIALSRERYARKREVVEAMLAPEVEETTPAKPMNELIRTAM